MLRLHAGQPEAEAESGPVSCCGNLRLRWNLQFSSFGVLWDFLHQFIRRVFYPFGRAPRLSQTSGMASSTTAMGRVRSSYIRRGKGLANSRPSAELRGSLDVGDRILEGFYISRADGTLQLLIYSTHPVFLSFRKIYIYKDLQFEVWNANQERESGTSSNRLVLPEAGVEAAEVHSPRRFRTLLSKTSAGSILASVSPT